METWRKALLERTEKDERTLIDKIRRSTERRIQRVLENCEARRKVIKNLRKPPVRMWGEDTLFISVNDDDFEIPHDVVRTLSLKLNKKPESDGINYRGQTKTGMKVNVYGVKNPPGCRLVKRTRVVPEKVEAYYEIVCDDKIEQ